MSIRSLIDLDDSIQSLIGYKLETSNLGRGLMASATSAESVTHGDTQQPIGAKNPYTYVL